MASRGPAGLAHRVVRNSGEALLRALDTDLGRDVTAVGKTTHVAARMEQLAHPGSTLLTRPRRPGPAMASACGRWATSPSKGSMRRSRPSSSSAARLPSAHRRPADRHCFSLKNGRSALLSPSTMIFELGLFESAWTSMVFHSRSSALVPLATPRFRADRAPPAWLRAPGEAERPCGDSGANVHVVAGFSLRASTPPRERG
jgi:hypothetical protein